MTLQLSGSYFRSSGSGAGGGASRGNRRDPYQARMRHVGGLVGLRLTIESPLKTRHCHSCKQCELTRVLIKEPPTHVSAAGILAIVLECS